MAAFHWNLKDVQDFLYLIASKIRKAIFSIGASDLWLNVVKPFCRNSRSSSFREHIFPTCGFLCFNRSLRELAVSYMFLEHRSACLIL